MQQLRRAIYVYELWTGLYMLDSSEKIAFSESMMSLQDSVVLDPPPPPPMSFISQTQLF
jgi:hypothetical protein